MSDYAWGSALFRIFINNIKAQIKAANIDQNNAQEVLGWLRRNYPGAI